MKTLVIIVTLLLSYCAVYAQQFQKKVSIKLASGTKPAQLMWIDADNDSLLDIVLTDSSKQRISAFAYSGIFKNVIKKDSLLTMFAQGNFTVTDFNLDDKMDLVFTPHSQSGIQPFLNDGNFLFTKSSNGLPVTGVSHSIYADFNNDGQKDVVITKDSTSLLFFKNKNQSFQQLFDSANFVIKDFSVFDFDGNGFDDIIFSGKNKNNQALLTVIQYKNNFDTLRIIHIPTANSGSIATGDLNHDGYFDVIVSGVNNIGQWANQSFLNHDSLFVEGVQYPGLKPSKVEIADFNSDGKADVSLFGKDNSGNTIHSIHSFTGEVVTIPSDHVLQEVFGDYDRDGDLDLLQVNDTLGLILWENIPMTKNAKPTDVDNINTYFIYSRLFAYWDKSSDDHTPSSALTYDLIVLAHNNEYAGGEFDLKNFSRMTVTNGNLGTDNFTLMKGPSGNTSVAVQSIDNSYYPSGRFLLKEVGGANPGGPSQICGIIFQDLNVCNNSPITLKADDTALWFSFSKGFVGKFTDLTVKQPSTDTLFSFIPATSGCPKLTVYNIIPSSKDTVHQKAYYAICQGNPANLTIDPQWQDVTWTKSGQTIGTGNQSAFNTSSNVVVKGTAKNDHGCFLSKINDVVISIPRLTLAENKYEIISGQNTQMSVSGGLTYLWSPPDGLNDPTASNPIASPTTSTLYTVTLTDSVGCTATGNVQVDVTRSAFLPSLFTPNGDGRNEEMKIYGLTQAESFHLTIVNREGAVVYETNDIRQATSDGWNGTHHGSLQPSGVYYWKVEGITNNGEPLHLNGKSQGSLMLIR